MLDQEWVKLILEAKELGLSLEEIKDFFKKNSQPELFTNQTKNRLSS